MLKINTGTGRIMTLVIILFLMLPGIALTQCKKHFKINQYFTNEGVIDGIDNYYQNLIIQDIALASQQTFREISLRFDYEIEYITDLCESGQVEISVLSVSVKYQPLLYQGFDISASLKPEKADLVFYVFQNKGIITDSLIFFDLPVERDSTLYSSLKIDRTDTSSAASVSFSRAIFHYTQPSYEIFRDRIMQIDEYFAATLIADSALAWADRGFLAETGSQTEMIMRQIELQRIMQFIRPGKFEPVLTPAQHDINGLTDKYEELVNLNNRYKAIIDYNHLQYANKLGNISDREMIENHLDKFDHYYQLAFQADFRFVNFIEDLSTPDLTNAGLLELHKLFNQHYIVSRYTSRFWSSFLAECFIERGNSFETVGNELRALTYYNAAYKLSVLMNLHEIKSTVFRLVCDMTNDIAASYIEISRKAALTENPAMAAQYYYNAHDLFNEKDFICPEPALLYDYKDWLLTDFENQVVRFIGMNDYSKALIYLNEIQSYCLTEATFHCPDQFHDWMRKVRDGIYRDLINKAQNLFVKDELIEAEQVYGQAIALRLKAGYRIDKDAAESRLEISFRQIHYDELVEEGLKYFNLEEFVSALYYLNKANYFERLSLIRIHPDLFTYRQEAARQIILQSLAEGRVKAWANDFDGTMTALHQVKQMMSDYGIKERDTLAVQYMALEENVRQKECEKVIIEFNDMILQADSASMKNDFILAYKIISDAVNFSMDHLSCKISDDEAWYLKVSLESPSDFQKLEIELNDLTGRSCSDYLASFQNLKNYYYRHKLLQQGVIFIPLFDRIIQAKDSAFLSGMLDHYIMLKDPDQALRLLERMRELRIPSNPVKDEQRSVAELLARRDAIISDISEPWDALRIYTGRDKWYRSLRWSYKYAWLKETNWKLKYWPFIWKN